MDLYRCWTALLFMHVHNVDKKMINIPETKYVVFTSFYLAHKCCHMTPFQNPTTF